MPEANVITMEEFRDFLSETLEVSQDTLQPEASFLNDLAIDSLKMVELVLRIESRLGISIPPDAAWSIQTVKDAYDFYANQVREGVQTA